MKENVFDVLMYLFENYYMDDSDAAALDQESMRRDLWHAGFPAPEVDRAFLWLEGLGDEINAPSMQAERSLRLFSESEMARLDTECRGFILSLEQMGILTPASRELAIDRAMALDSEDFDIEQLKWVILMVLFNQPGQEAAYAWIEELVFDDVANHLH